MKNYKFVTLLMDKHEYPEEAKKVISNVNAIDVEVLL